MKCDICGGEYDDEYNYLFESDWPCYCEIIKLLKEKDDEIERLKNKTDLFIIEKQLKNIGVSEEGVKIMRCKFVFKVVLLKNIDYGSANLLKQNMLSVGGEVAVSKGVYCGDIIKTDVYIGGTLKQFQELMTKILSNKKLNLYIRIQEELKNDIQKI